MRSVFNVGVMYFEYGRGCDGTQSGIKRGGKRGTRRPSARKMCGKVSRLKSHDIIFLAHRSFALPIFFPFDSSVIVLQI